MYNVTMIFFVSVQKKGLNIKKNQRIKKWGIGKRRTGGWKLSNKKKNFFHKVKSFLFWFFLFLHSNNTKQSWRGGKGWAQHTDKYGKNEKHKARNRAVVKVKCGSGTKHACTHWLESWWRPKGFLLFTFLE